MTVKETKWTNDKGDLESVCDNMQNLFFWDISYHNYLNSWNYYVCICNMHVGNESFAMLTA